MNKQLSFSRVKGGSGPGGGRQWVHSAETLMKSRVIYNVKFLGHVEVEQPKGADMVKEAIRKMKFNKQIKKAEGQKSTRVELTISIDAISIQDPKYKIIQFQYPLHLVSYCADDKSDKRMFTFIAKEKTSDKHHCFVFDSDRSAEEITLTVGQAFDLAYRRFIESNSGKDIDSKKQLLHLQKQVNDLTQENKTLKERVIQLEKLLDSKQLVQVNGGGQRTMDHPIVSESHSGAARLSAGNLMLTNGDIRTVSQTTSPSALNIPLLTPPPPVPSRSSQVQLGTQPNNYSTAATLSPTSNAFPVTSQVDLFGATPFNVPPFVSSPPPPATNVTLTNPFFLPLTPPVSSTTNLLHFHPSVMSPISPSGPFGDSTSDVFGMNVFSPTDGELLDMQTNFSRGLSFGTEDFSLDELDPIKK